MEEEKTVNFTQRLLEKESRKYFCKGDISPFFDVKTAVSNVLLLSTFVFCLNE